MSASKYLKFVNEGERQFVELKSETAPFLPPKVVEVINSNLIEINFLLSSCDIIEKFKRDHVEGHHNLDTAFASEKESKNFKNLFLIMEHQNSKYGFTKADLEILTFCQLDHNRGKLKGSTMIDEIIVRVDGKEVPTESAAAAAAAAAAVAERVRPVPTRRAPPPPVRGACHDLSPTFKHGLETGARLKEQRKIEFDIPMYDRENIKLDPDALVMPPPPTWSPPWPPVAKGAKGPKKITRPLSPPPDPPQFYSSPGVPPTVSPPTLLSLLSSSSPPPFPPPPPPASLSLHALTPPSPPSKGLMVEGKPSTSADSLSTPPPLSYWPPSAPAKPPRQRASELEYMDLTDSGKN